MRYVRGDLRNEKTPCFSTSHGLCLPNVLTVYFLLCNFILIFVIFRFQHGNPFYYFIFYDFFDVFLSIHVSAKINQKIVQYSNCFCHYAVLLIYSSTIPLHRIVRKLHISLILLILFKEENRVLCFISYQKCYKSSIYPSILSKRHIWVGCLCIKQTAFRK